MSAPERPDAALSPEELRWLHDKYERLAAEETHLVDSRTSYFAAITAALVAGLVLLIINELRSPPVFVAAASFLATLGVLVSAVWAVVLHRTSAAQRLWRAAAAALERSSMFPQRSLPARLAVHQGLEITIDLTRPYLAHAERFAGTHGLPWVDRVEPSELSSDLPVLLVGAWLAAFGAIWVWFVWLA